MDTINIVLATDNNYVQHCAVTIASILKNNSNVSIYVLTEDLSEYNKKILYDEVARFRSELHFVHIEKEIIDSLPMPSHAFLSHISRATYYRLLLPNIISSDVDKVLYLDCDLVVNTSIYDLWGVDLECYALAACKQIGGLRDACRLGIPQRYGYFNAGVLLINIAYWRQHNISEQLIDYLFNNGDKVVFHDQDALNAVLFEKCLYLHQQWNMNFATYSNEFLKLEEDYSQEISEAKCYQQNPSILHYSARIKPWDWKCTHPMIDLYYDYAKLTQHYNGLKYPSIFIKFLAKLRERSIKYLVRVKSFIR